MIIHDTKKRLIDTALFLITKSAYLSVSVNDICREAGVQKGSFYYFFPSKTDLAMAAIETHFRHSQKEWETIFSLETPPLQRFQDFAAYLIAKQKEKYAAFGRVCGCPFATLGAEMAGQEKRITKKVNEIFAYFETCYAQAIEESIAGKTIAKTINPSAKAQEIYTYIVGHMVMARIQNTLSYLENNLEKGIFLILGVPVEAHT